MNFETAIFINEAPRRRRTGVAVGPATDESLARLRLRLVEQCASAATIKIYHGWVRRFLLSTASRVREPAAAIDQFVRWMQANACSVASQRQALAALGYYYREVVGSDVSAALGPHRPSVSRRRANEQSPQGASNTFELIREVDLVRRLMESTGRPAGDILDLRIGDIVLDGDLVRLRFGTPAATSTQFMQVPSDLGLALIEQIGESWRVHQLDFLQWLESQDGRESTPRRMATEVFKLRTLFPATSAPAEFDPLQGREALSREQLGASVRRARARRPRLSGREPLSSRAGSESPSSASALAVV